MIRVFKNKKNLVAIILVLLIAVSGGTYAWFTSISNTQAVFNFGRLNVKVESIQDDANAWYEPGTEINLGYKISNPASSQALPACVKVDLVSGKALIWSDADGNQLSSSYSVPIPEGGINALIPTDYKSFVMDGEGNIKYCWLEAIETPGFYYLLIMPGVEVNLGYNIQFNGDKFDNSFQGAQFDFSKEWIATQVIDDAVQSIYGINPETLNLALFPTDSTSSLKVQRSSLDDATQEAVLQQVRKMFSR